MSGDYRLAIDQLVKEHGKKEGRYWKATVDSSQILARLNLFPEINRSHHRYVKRVVDWQYEGTRSEAIGPNADDGWIFHIKVRSK